MKRDRMKKSEGLGFSLIELLAVIFIISLVFGIGGYYAINTISNSKDKSSELALANAKTTARYYVEEYPDEVVWEKDEATGNRRSCIITSKLIDKGYLKTKDLENDSIDKTTYVIITKDASNNIIKEEIDTSGTCGEFEKATMVEIPTNKNCNTLIYNGEQQTLVEANNSYYHFSNNQGTDAGAYSIVATLNEGYTWSDGSKDNKTITCSIKRAIPNLSLTPPGTGTTKIEKLTTTLNTNVSGTIQLRSSNTDYVTVAIPDGDNHINENSTKDIEIQTLATRKKATYVTITLTPDDTKNYFTGSVIYTIADVSREKIDIPTASYCNNLTYNGSRQTLVKALSSSAGFQFSNIYGTNAGDYTVTAKLKYGYLWSDGSTEDKTITCSIQKRTPPLTLVPSSGTVNVKKSISFTATSSVVGKIKIDNNSTYINTPSISNNTGTMNQFPITITAKGQGTTNLGIKVNFIPRDTTNYKATSATYRLTINNRFNLTYNSNGGSACSNKSVTYGSTYGALCTPTKQGYNFAGWYTASSGGTSISANTPVTTASDHTIYAHWTPATYTLTYNSNGGNSCSPISKNITYGSLYGTLCVPTRTGHRFDGWYTASSGGTQIAANTTVNVTTNQIVYAHWTPNTYTITFNSNGGKDCDPQTINVAYGESYNANNQWCGRRTKKNYKFAGWWTAETGGIRKYSTNKVTGNETLYAHWEEKTVTRYTVTFNTHGGTRCNPDSIEVKSGEQYKTEGWCDNTKKTGYEFAGWWTAETGGIRKYSTDIVTGNGTLHAHWKIHTDHLWNARGDVIYSINPNWTCTGRHSHDTAYKIYCSICGIEATESPTLVCPTQPYGTNDYYDRDKDIKWVIIHGK